MTFEDFRARMERTRTIANEAADALKDPMRALERMNGFYHALDPAERLLADRVLAEWVLSDDEDDRFDAVALIRYNKVVSAGPALCELMVRLAASADPMAPYEQKKVARLIEKLRLEPAADA